ncbi:MAG TPA: protein-methionine-sulfoxide reductase catalytic subunit MsrP [Rhodospirillales bacterium]|jgi:sulfoxide reductase catalytic subunit YedY|nr:MAG: Protein-methionine-sulfoxide reductase catalytic subunit MsrP [Alphaproteobacteria bacterium MarineAlpha3_Bin1]PPR71912.1 MAG: Protein-methionine-sulfoxide reductase catalytic subunit MsrP [Alphaproteobacteria bacterium MarineAlpha3_Bin2]HIM26069.1 protein-methionine-sulfoxide reductase catalytic subunit MsrP [Rhodospirillales bacterium]
MLIKSKKASDVRSSEITSPSVYLDRRRFLQSAAMVGAGAAFGTIAGPALAATEKTRVKLAGVNKTKWTQESLGEKLTDYGSVTRYNNFYEFGTGKTDPADNSNKFMPRPWNLAVDGAVEKPGVYDLEDFLKPHQLEERVYRFRCVEAWSMVIPWVGIPLADVIKRMNPAGNAKYVAFETLKDAKRMPGQRRAVLDWPYREGLRMDEAMNPLSFLVVGLYGEVLPNQNGAPLRLMVPWKYGFKSIKSIVKMTFQEKEPPTSWNMASAREYGFYSNVNPTVNHPRWSQARERRIGDFLKRPTKMFNGYEEEVGQMYAGMDLRKNY